MPDEETDSTSLTTSASTPPSPSLHPDLRECLSSSRKAQKWEVEEEANSLPVSPSSSTTVNPWKHRTSHSNMMPGTPLRAFDEPSSPKCPEVSPPSSPKPPSSTQTSVSSSSKETPNEDCRHRSKPPLAPKPRISSTGRVFGRHVEPPNQPEKPTIPPDSPPLIRELHNLESPISKQPDLPDFLIPPSAEEVTPPDSPTAAAIREEGTESADLVPPTRELPPSTPRQQRRLEDLPDEEPVLPSSTAEVKTQLIQVKLTVRIIGLVAALSHLWYC